METPAAVNAARAPAGKAVPAKWLLCLALAILSLCLTYWPDALSMFRLDRSALASGEIWRLLSGHLVHMNTPHLMLNLLALFLLCELLWRELDWRHVAGLLLCAALGISAALLSWHPGVAWYAGLSGILHGLWAACAWHGAKDAKPTSTSSEKNTADTWRARWPLQRRICALAFALLGLKLAMEWYLGPSQRTALAIGGEVIAVAHAYGALSGFVYLQVWRLASRFLRAASPGFRLK